MNIKLINNNIKIIILFFFLSLNQNIIAFENRILIKINDEIVTTIDLLNEIRYLSALNKNLNNLDQKSLIELSKNSIINEKIKKIELEKSFIKQNIEKEYIDKIIENFYLNLGLNSPKDFENYLSNSNIDISMIVKKIEIELLWNRLIFEKYKEKISINKNELEQQIKNIDKKETKLFDLSEIIFSVSQEENLEEKLKKINDDIKKVGFENAASIYSNSNSSRIGGKIGWIKQSSLNKSILNKIINLDISEISEPIIVPGGFLILKMNDIKSELNEIDPDQELKKLIRIKTDEQLNQFSLLYFNKIKKDYLINEL